MYFGSSFSVSSLKKYSVVSRFSSSGEWVEPCMGEHEEWAQPSGLLPNGLLPNAGPLTRVFDSERWLKAEERTGELIACIQPNQPSEERRNAVADYVQRLITKCFPCQVVVLSF